jgi:DNA-binding CsgD family transcriptional regulator
LLLLPRAGAQAVLDRALCADVESAHVPDVGEPDGDTEAVLLRTGRDVLPAARHGVACWLLLLPASRRDRLERRVRRFERRYGLTPAEARLVHSLGEGKDLAAAALQAGHELETARSMLKRVLAKSGTGRQSRLLVELFTI